ncbi:MAG: hypothetical protein ACOCSK_01730 [Rhodothermales bacterium]
MANSLEKAGIGTRIIDPFRATAQDESRIYRLEGGRRAWAWPAILGSVFFVVALIGWLVDAHHFYFSYLVGWTFCLSIALGALFFVVIQHLTKARWSVVVRRMAESIAWSIPLLALLSIPLFFGLHDLYHWTHEELHDPTHPDYDPLVAGKSAYLNVPFFVVRIILYLALWSLIAYKLYRLSLLQDVHPDPSIPSRQRKVSAWGLPVLAVTVSFASYDLLMSTDPHWFSTIFGVYFFAGAFFAILAVLTLMGLALQRGGIGFQRLITVEHYHDLGKLMFGFTVFWAYIAFSQYMLIWYGNIPEETVWYRHRLEGGWEYHSLALLLLHFVVPFIVLLPRTTKRMQSVLAVMAVWFLVMHWFDLHWLVMPVLSHYGGFHWIDFAAWLGLGGLFAGMIMFRLSRHSLVPRNDPYLQESLRFENI